MRIIEILLPKTMSKNDLLPKAARDIQMLQNKIDRNVDALHGKKLSPNARDFLIQVVRDDVDEMKKKLADAGYKPTDLVAEGPEPKYEVYDRKTGEKVSGPYADRRRASRAADKWDLKYGAIRYGYRPVQSTISEAVTKLPLTPKDFEFVKKMMERPIPAVVAPIYIHQIIEDDALDAELAALEESEPGRDVRPLIAEWFDRVMPDQRFRFTDAEVPEDQKKGTYSPIHGYDPHMYKGTNDPITGDAYGFY
jgi:hypothetical protein